MNNQAIVIPATERPALGISAGETIHARTASTRQPTNQTSAQQCPAAAESSGSQALVTATTEVPSTQTNAADTPQPATPDSNDSATEGCPAETASPGQQPPDACATATPIAAHPTAEAAARDTSTQHVTTFILTSPPQNPTATDDDSDSSDSADSDWTSHDSNDDLSHSPNSDHDHSDHGGDGGGYDSDLDLPPAKYRRLNQPPNPRGISEEKLDGLVDDEAFPPDRFAVPTDYSIDADADHGDTDEETTNSVENETSSSSSSSDEEPSLSLADRAWRKIQNGRELTRESKRRKSKMYWRRSLP